jgi:hypothetical protein
MEKLDRLFKSESWRGRFIPSGRLKLTRVPLPSGMSRRLRSSGVTIFGFSSIWI